MNTSSLSNLWKCLCWPTVVTVNIPICGGIEKLSLAREPLFPILKQCCEEHSTISSGCPCPTMRMCCMSHLLHVQYILWSASSSHWYLSFYITAVMGDVFYYPSWSVLACSRRSPLSSVLGSPVPYSCTVSTLSVKQPLNPDLLWSALGSAALRVLLKMLTRCSTEGSGFSGQLCTAHVTPLPLNERAAVSSPAKVHILISKGVNFTRSLSSVLF